LKRVEQPKSWLMPTMVAVVAAAAAGWAFHLNWVDVRNRWTRFDTDTNTHAYVLLGLAQNAWNLDAYGWYKDFDGPRSWPPLHGIAGSFVQLAAGKLDVRLAIVPSLFGWWLTAFCAALAARRLTKTSGDLAGYFAALFVLASPSHRIFAADVMLESLGAGLSMLCIWTYLRAKQIGGHREWTWFGASLTLLMVEKYNYWMLIAAPILGVEVLRQLYSWWTTPGSLRAITSFITSEVRRPLTILALLIGTVAFGGFFLARLQVPIGGKPFRLDAFLNVFEVFAIVVMLRVFQRRRQVGPEWLAVFPDNWRGLFLGHGLPMLAWFCLPKRMGTVMEWLTRRHSTEEYTGWWSGVEFYVQMAVQHYSVHWVLAALTAACIVVAFLRLHRLNAGAAVVFAALILCVLLTTAHPQRGSRFLHSWFALAWVVAGVGFAGLASLIRPHLARQGIGVAAMLLLAFLQGPSLLERGSSSEMHHQPTPTTLAAADFYLDEVQDAGRVAFISNVQISDFARWTYTERFPKRPRIDCFMKGFGSDRAKNEKLLEQWTPKYDAIVSIDVDKNSVQYFPGYENFAQYREHLETQTRFSKASVKQFPALGCTVTIWRPTPEAATKQIERTLVR
jgi:hypothetical protein